MTMVTITASEFKAKCLALMDQVLHTGETILITKNGKPVAQLAPPPSGKAPQKDPFGLHRGRVRPLGEVDLDAPVIDAAAWTADQENLASRRP